MIYGLPRRDGETEFDLDYCAMESGPEADAETFEERWKRLEEVVALALMPYPEARGAVQAALEGRMPHGRE